MAYCRDAGTAWQSTERGHKMREGECRNGLICATGQPPDLTSLWEGPQDTSFIKGVRNALVRRATLSLRNSVRSSSVWWPWKWDAAMKSVSPVSKGMIGAGSLAFWFPPDWSTSTRTMNSGGYSPSASLWGCHRLPASLPCRAYSLSCRQVHFPPPPPPPPL